MAEAGMIQALTLNPVTELAEEPTAALPNPDAKKTPKKIKYRTYYFVYISSQKDLHAPRWTRAGRVLY